MENKNQPKKRIELIKSQKSYKLFIPLEVEKKIRYLCQQISDIEWSGALFYTPEGSFEDDSLVIKCTDIFPMDIGTAAYTEFDMSPDVISYMAYNPELLDCQVGLIHSHNKMATFFSGTDINTLAEEGMDRSHFVSLIVNNAGSYTAAITRKIKSQKVIKDNYNYPTFGNKIISENKDYFSETEVIEYFNLNIEIEKEECIHEELKNRLEELRKTKAAFAYKPPYLGAKPLQASIPFPKEEKKINKPAEVKEIIEEEVEDIPLSEIIDTLGEEDPETIIPYGHIRFNEDLVNSVVLQIITGSVIVPNSHKIDVKKWAENLPTIFGNRFGTDEEGIKAFTAWASNHIDFICWYTEDKHLIDEGLDDGEMAAILAHDVIEKLTELDMNEYIKIYIDILQEYIY